MAVLETSTRAGSGGDKNNKDCKYTLDNGLQVALKFNDESNYSYLSDYRSIYSEVSIQRLQPTTTCFCPWLLVRETA